MESSANESAATDGDTGEGMRDQDGDGYLSFEDGGPDCDDTDPNIHPFAEETIDGIDQDCDGLIDDGTDAFDGDGDSWTIGLDCDDTDPDTWPGAPENPCDAQDQDCDGELGVCTRADVAFARFVPTGAGGNFGFVAGGGDFSGDGTPDIASGLNSVTHLFDAPVVGGELTGLDSFARIYVAGVLGANGDIVFANPLSGNGSAELIISRTQQESDGMVFLFCDPLFGDVVAEETACATYLDGDSTSSFGWVLDAGADVTGDGLGDLLIGAPFTTNSIGVAYIVSGDARGDVDVTGDSVQVWGYVADDRVGYAVAMSGDNNSDGVEDILVGALGVDGSGGTVGWFMGPIIDTSLIADADVLYTAGNGRYLTYSQAGRADVDGDGRVDFALTSWEEGIGGIHIYTEFGAGSLDGATAHLLGVERLSGSQIPGDYLGYSLALPDANGDGLGDVLAGAPSSMLGGNGYHDQFGWVEPSGAVALFLAPFSGTRTMLEADSLWFGEDEDDSLGNSVSSAGDTNGDGLDDLLAGAGTYNDPNDGVSDPRGANYLFLGKESW